MLLCRSALQATRGRQPVSEGGQLFVILNRTYFGDTKLGTASSSRATRFTLNGETMNRQLIRAAGIAAVLMLTASAGHAQSRPFAGLDGAWSGNGTEVTRNIVGNLQGTAGGGKVDVVVEAPGFTASLLMRTNGNRQSVQINSKGDIRSVTITMVKS